MLGGMCGRLVYVFNDGGQDSSNHHMKRPRERRPKGNEEVRDANMGASALHRAKSNCKGPEIE